MQLPRFVGLVDLGIATVIFVAVVLPARERYATTVIKGDEPQQFAVALAEARTMARPGDGLATEAFVRKLDEANQKDWAIEVAMVSSERSKDSPTRWRALLATASAYVDRLDVVPGLDYANRAISACEAIQDKDASACPNWEEVRLRLYQQNLDAGVKSGIDPHHDPRGFRKASESVMHQVHLGIPRGNSAPSMSGSDTRPGSSGSGSAQ